MSKQNNPISLIPFTPECITDEFLSWLQNKQLLRYSRQSRMVHSKESCQKYLESFKNTNNIYWSIRNENDEQVGTMTAYIDAHSCVADIGILVGRSGQGIGKKAWGQAIRFLFEETNVRKITAGTLSVHQNMISIFEHWGMLREGVFKEQELLNEQLFDVVRYGLLKKDWLTQQSN